MSVQEQPKTEQEKAEAAKQALDVYLDQLQQATSVEKLAQYSAVLSALRRKVVSLAKGDLRLHPNSLITFNAEKAEAELHYRYETNVQDDYMYTSGRAPLEPLISRHIGDVSIVSESDNLLAGNLINEYGEIILENEYAMTEVSTNSRGINLGRMLVRESTLYELSDYLHGWLESANGRPSEANYQQLASAWSDIVSGEQDWDSLIKCIDALRTNPSVLLGHTQVQVRTAFTLNALKQIPIPPVNLDSAATVANDLTNQLRQCIGSGQAELIDAGVSRIEVMLERLEDSVARITNEDRRQLQADAGYELLVNDAIQGQLIPVLRQYYDDDTITRRILTKLIWTPEYDAEQSRLEKKAKREKRILDFAQMVQQRSSRTVMDLDLMRSKIQMLTAAGEAMHLDDLDEKMLQFNSKMSGLAINLIELCDSSGLGRDQEDGGSLSSVGLSRLMSLRSKMEDALYRLAGGDYTGGVLAQGIDYLQSMLEVISNMYSRPKYGRAYDRDYFQTMWRGVMSSFWARVYYENQGLQLIPFKDDKEAYAFDQSKKVDLIMQDTVPNAFGELPKYYVQVKSGPYTMDVMPSQIAGMVDVKYPQGGSGPIPEREFMRSLSDDHRSIYLTLKAEAQKASQPGEPVYWRFIFVNPTEPKVI